MSSMASGFKPLENEPAMKGLTTTLLRQAAADAASWPGDLVFSFNIAACRIGELATTVLVPPKDQTAFLAPHRIEVEISETALTDDQEATRQLVVLPQEQGARVALDNFGGERANPRHIRGIPLQPAEERPRVRPQRAARHACRDVRPKHRHGRPAAGNCRDRGGHCDAGDRKRVRELGCSFAQGSFYGMPVPAREAGFMMGRLAQLLSEPVHPRHSCVDRPVQNE